MINHEGLKVAQVDALIHVTTAVGSHLEFSEVLASILRASTEVLQAEAAALVLVDADKQDLEFHVARAGDTSAPLTGRLRPGVGIAGQVIESSRPIIVDYARHEAGPTSANPIWRGFEIRSVLCVPVLRSGRLWGALEVVNRKDRRPFSVEDQFLCDTIAGQAAIAIENARLHKQLLERERVSAIGDTVAGLAHCVRNTLSGIEGGAYMVDLGLREEDAVTIRQGWEIVRRKNAVMQDLVLDLLSYSTGHTPDYEPVDIDELVSGVIGMMKTRAQTLGVKLEWEPARQATIVGVEPKGIRRCLLNLVGNAIDACDGRENGSVTVQVHAPENGHFSIEVVDNGCGIAPDVMATLFEPFHSTKGGAGTGLGLAVTRKIVTEHGGKLNVDSEPGMGSCFQMVLPARAVAYRPGDDRQMEEATERSAPTASAAMQGAQDWRGKSVLLVDDDPDILTFVRAALWSLDGLEVRTALDGNRALAIARKRQPDLIVLDLQMPGKDGLSTFRELRSDARTRHIPVIILTGSREQTGISLSATDIGGYVGHEPELYLHKPVFPAVLQRKVAELLQSKPHGTQSANTAPMSLG